MALASYQGMN